MACPGGGWLEKTLKMVLFLLVALFVIVNYLSYVSVQAVAHRPTTPATSSTTTHILGRHIPPGAWKRSTRDPFKVCFVFFFVLFFFHFVSFFRLITASVKQTTAVTTSPSISKGLLEEFIELVAPTEVPADLSRNGTDELAVENAVSLERDTGE